MRASRLPSFSGTCLAVVPAMAIAAIRRPETQVDAIGRHLLLDAAVARWFLTFLAPRPPGPPPVPVTIPSLSSPFCSSSRWLRLARAPAHPVYVYGGIADRGRF
jgi:hypothetical protein